MHPQWNAYNYLCYHSLLPIYVGMILCISLKDSHVEYKDNNNKKSRELLEGPS